MKNIGETENRTRNWSDFNPDLLNLVVKKIQVIEDLFAFRGVCNSWRSAAAKENLGGVMRQIPLLMLTKKDIVSDNLKPEFQEIQENTVVNNLGYASYYTHPIVLSDKIIPLPMGWKGWLLLTEKKTRNNHLVHVFSRNRIVVPSIYGCPPRKVVLSSCPFTNPRDYILMTIFGVRRLAFWRPGDEHFTRINYDKVEDESLADVIFYDGLVYAITRLGFIRVFDVTKGNTPREIVEKRHNERFPVCIDEFLDLYLVELGGELVVVVQIRREKSGERLLVYKKVTKFRVFRIDPVYNKWKEVMDIGNRAIFVGLNASFSVNASEILGCIPNSVYFVGDNISSKRVDEEVHHMGVYNLTCSRIVYSHCSTLNGSSSCGCKYPPFWVMPTIL